MIKQTILALLFCADFTIQAEETTATTANIKFTQEELILFYDIFGLFGDRSTVGNNFSLLGMQCGWGFFSRPDSYDPQEYRNCKKVLAFMKHYRQERSKLDAEANHLLYKEIYGLD